MNPDSLHTTVDPCINIRVSCNIQIYFAILSVLRKYLETAYKTNSVGEPLFLQADRCICKNTLDVQPEEKGDFSDGCINMRVNAQLCKGDSSVMQESERIAAGKSCREKFADANLTIYG